MADKADKPKKSKAKSRQDEKGVLAALPSTRPERIGGRRAATPAPAPKTTTATAASKAAAKPPAKPAPARKPAAKPAPAPKTTTATAASKTAAKSANGSPEQPAARRAATPRVEPTARPRPVREGAPGIGTQPDREQPSAESGRPSGVELVGTAVQAAGELAQIGLSIGGRILKRATDRLPKP